MSKNNLSKYLEAVIDKNGLEVLSNEKKTINLIAARFKNSAEERRLLKIAYSSGVMAELLAGRAGSKEDFDNSIKRAMEIVDSSELSPEECGDLVKELSLVLTSCRDVKAPPTGKTAKLRGALNFFAVLLFLLFAALFLINTGNVGRLFTDSFAPFNKALYEYLAITASFALLLGGRGLRSGNDRFSTNFIIFAFFALIILPIASSLIHGVGFFVCLIRVLVAAVLGVVGMILGAMASPSKKTN